MTLTRGALALLVLGLGAAAYGLRPRPERPRRVSANASPYRPVRHAGPEEMAMPPGRWDTVDELADESFPASDPPGTY